MFRFTRLIFAALVLLQTGCFSDSSSTSDSESKATTSLITSSSFAGASSATNTITGINIKWTASLIAPTAYRVYRVSGTQLSLLTSLAPSITAFIDGAIAHGGIYTYIVRAVDANGIEDTNTAKVSALAWGGIISASATGRSTVEIDFEGATPVADEVRIYVQSASGGDKTLAATVSGSDTSASLSGLNPGYTYKVSAQAYVASLGKEDGNTSSMTVTTKTYGYDTDGGSAPMWMNVVNVRAFGPSPGAAVSPSHPERTPQTALVELEFVAFNGASASTQYIVERAGEGNSLDPTVETPCETSTLTSCRVKCATNSFTITGSGALNCRDLKTDNSPARYRYTMSILHTLGGESWAEPLPADELDMYSVSVPIPPANMVLVQRDAVNYEMCGQMNAASDPFHHNRCIYSGVGAVPYNSGPNKAPLTFDAGYYDFGYNLFEDRFMLGCNWTTAAKGGKCGAGQPAGDCIGTSDPNTAPANTIGVDGNVYYLIYNQASGAGQRCYYKSAGSWVAAYTLPTASSTPVAALAQAFTSDPAAGSGKIPQSYEDLSQISGWDACQGQVDPTYGAKRLPRMREYRAYTAFPTNSMDSYLYGITLSQATTLVNGGGFNSSTGYRCSNNVTTSTVTNTSGTSIYPASLSAAQTSDLASFYTGGVYYGRSTFWSGRVSNVDCQSRYGAQDPFGPPAMWTSDMFNVNYSTKLYTGTVSPFDSGNRDLLQDINGGLTGYQMSYSTASADTNNRYFYNFTATSTTPVNYIAIPLGLPVFSATSTVYLPRLLFTESYSAAFTYLTSTTTSNTPASVSVNNRWKSYSYHQGVSGTNWSAVRCVMSAD